MLVTIVFSVLIGVVAGFLWGSALGATSQTGLLTGAIVGVLLGLLLGFFGKTARMGGNLKESETVFVNGAILTMLAVFAIGTGLLAWIIRLVFF